jgi:hypothetical protein
MAQSVVKPPVVKPEDKPEDKPDETVQSENPVYDPWSDDARPADIGKRVRALEDARYGENVRPAGLFDTGDNEEA